MNDIPDTPLYDRKGSLRGYKMNKMAMALGTSEGRAAFKADEAAFIDRFGLDELARATVLNRDWKEMCALVAISFLSSRYPQWTQRRLFRSARPRQECRQRNSSKQGWGNKSWQN